MSGAHVSHILNELDVACLPKDLPSSSRRTSELSVGQSLHVSGMKLPAGVVAVTRGKLDPVVVARGDAACADRDRGNGGYRGGRRRCRTGGRGEARAGEEGRKEGRQEEVGARPRRPVEARHAKHGEPSLAAGCRPRETPWRGSRRHPAPVRAQPMIRLVVGLGNPGREYDATRHNAGHWFADALAGTLGAAFVNEGKFQGQVAKTSGDVRLLKPQTYMNLSGRAVSAVARSSPSRRPRSSSSTTSSTCSPAKRSSSSAAAWPATTGCATSARSSARPISGGCGWASAIRANPRFHSRKSSTTC